MNNEMTAHNGTQVPIHRIANGNRPRSARPVVAVDREVYDRLAAEAAFHRGRSELTPVLGWICVVLAGVGLCQAGIIAWSYGFF